MLRARKAGAYETECECRRDARKPSTSRRNRGIEDRCLNGVREAPPFISFAASATHATSATDRAVIDKDERNARPRSVSAEYRQGCSQCLLRSAATLTGA